MELNSDARMKLSQDIEKVTIPGKKEAYRLYGGDGKSPSGKPHNKAGTENHNTFCDFFKTQLENLKKLANFSSFKSISILDISWRRCGLVVSALDFRPGGRSQA